MKVKFTSVLLTYFYSNLMAVNMVLATDRGLDGPNRIYKHSEICGTSQTIWLTYTVHLMISL